MYIQQCSCTLRLRINNAGRWYQITKKQIEFENLNKWSCAQSTLVPGALQYIQ